MAPADGHVRLDTVVHRRDRLFEATAAALFIGLIAPLAWLLVLICFWGLLGMLWLSLVIGLACTAALIRWGARLGRGSLERARRVPYLVITADEMLAWHVAGPGLTRVPLAAIRVVAIDAPPARQRRADRVRFPVGVSEDGPVGWLHCPDRSRLFTAGIGVEKTPNIAILFNRPVSLGPDTAARAVPGFLVAVTDPRAARAAFLGRVPVRPLVVADLDGICPPSALPVQRLGRHGLREVRPEDRVRARVVDIAAMYAIFTLLLLRLARPGAHELLGALTAFFVAWFVCDVPSVALTGQTLGRFVLGLRVVRIEDGRARLGLGQAFARSLLRLLNASAGALAFSLAHGDALGRVAPRLSLMDGIGAGTILVPEGEYQRMRSEMSARQRGRALADTVAFIKRWEPTVTGRAAWISVAVVLLFAGTTVGYLAAHARPGTAYPVSPATGPPAGPLPPLPTGAVVTPSSLPTPSFSIPIPAPSFSVPLPAPGLSP